MLELCFAITMHFGINAEFNNLHPCVKYTADDFTIGAYWNSRDKMSYYVSHTFGDEWFTEVGIVTGYYDGLAPLLRIGREFDNDVIVFASPIYRRRTDEVGIVVGVEYSIGVTP